MALKEPWFILEHCWVNCPGEETQKGEGVGVGSPFIVTVCEAHHLLFLSILVTIQKSRWPPSIWEERRFKRGKALVRGL